MATTSEGREILAVRISSPCGEDSSKLRVLLFAQQHGDEPCGKEALTLLLADCARGACDDLLEKMDLVVVPQMNPDGAERRQRRNSEGIDLNRSHLLLHTPEVRGLHDLFAAWMPEVTMDIHEYGSFSKEWVDGGFVKSSDVQLGMLTNLNSPAALRTYQRTTVFPFVAAAMAEAGYSFSEYVVGSPQDRLRHSTTEINDGRQSFGILGTLSFIQEGRKWRTLDEQLKRRSQAQYAATKALLKFVAEHAGQIKEMVRQERESLASAHGKRFYTRMDHVAGASPLVIPVMNARSGRDTTWTVTPYHGVVRAFDSTIIPSAYIIPAELKQVIELLGRHRLQTVVAESLQKVSVEEYTLEQMGTCVIEEDTLPAPVLKSARRSYQLRPGDVLVPTSQMHSLFLASVLEPASLWGLLKYPSMAESLVTNRQYRILRLP